MKRSAMIVVLTICILLPSIASAVTEKDFEVQTTENLINLCTAEPGDPLYQQAINFCHGYLVGAFHYYQVVSAGSTGLNLVCLPDPQPSRDEAFAMFIEWAKANPQYLKEKAIDTEFRFLMQQWPCKQ